METVNPFQFLPTTENFLKYVFVTIGVIWHPQGPIDGAAQLLESLRNMVCIAYLGYFILYQSFMKSHSSYHKSL